MPCGRGAARVAVARPERPGKSAAGGGSAGRALPGPRGRVEMSWELRSSSCLGQSSHGVSGSPEVPRVGAKPAVLDTSRSQEVVGTHCQA